MNLIALVVVVFILVLLRLPDILEVHGMEFPWAKRERELSGRPAPAAQREQRKEQPVEPEAEPAAGPASSPFEPQLVGSSGAAAGGGDDKKRDEIFGATTVGGSKFADMPQ